MASQIFISYRREDSKEEASFIYGYLQSHFGKKAVFMDQSTVQHGDHWRECILDGLEEAPIVLAVIKYRAKWLGVDDEGIDRRINDPDDWVRSEMRVAIDSKKTLLPLLLVGEEQLPSERALPDDIKSLLSPQARVLSLEQGWESPNLRELVETCKKELQRRGIVFREKSELLTSQYSVFGTFGSLAAILNTIELSEEFVDRVNRHQVDLRRFVDGAQQVRKTKYLHDIAHSIQIQVVGVAKRKRMVNGISERYLKFDFEDIKEGISTALDGLATVRSKMPEVCEEEDWVKEFNLGLMELETAIRGRNTKLVSQQINKLDSVLKKLQADLNARLVRWIDNSLCLESVTKGLRELLSFVIDDDCSNTSGRDVVDHELATFSDEFISLREIHDIWTQIDNEIGNLESVLGDKGNDERLIDAKYVFLEIETRLRMVSSHSNWSEQPKRFLERLDEHQNDLRRGLLQPEDPNVSDIQELLVLFSDPARKLFHSVDCKLKNRCDDLISLGRVVGDVLAVVESREERQSV